MNLVLMAQFICVLLSMREVSGFIQPNVYIAGINDRCGSQDAYVRAVM